jgi:hypothetical protein
MPTQAAALAASPRFLTLDEAGAILGGSRPLSTATIRRLIAAGRLRATADTRKLRRVIAASVYALADALEHGGSLWHAHPAPSAAPVCAVAAAVGAAH